MKTMSVGDFKANFSAVLKLVLAGEEVGILYGKKKEMVAMMVPKTEEKKKPRTIGILEGKGKVVLSKDYKITEKEFLGL
jgi:antitoxin (DNA-binding transcriptional repressor) of toxin-antitoxin stability system